MLRVCPEPLAHLTTQPQAVKQRQRPEHTATAIHKPPRDRNLKAATGDEGQRQERRANEEPYPQLSGIAYRIT
jgi:hypothetical protein